MRALLLAAGHGSRLRPITATVPKCLVIIGGRPLLDYWLELLLAGGIERVLINTHWLAEEVAAHVRRSPFASSIDLAPEQALLGTAGTILHNRAWFREAPFLVAHADNFTDFDLTVLVAAHAARPHSHAITMLGFRTDDPQSCGVLEVDPRGTVHGFHEKVANPPGNLANGAVYIFEPEVIDAIEAIGRPQVDLSTEIIPRFLGRILCVETQGYHRDIGTLESLRRARADHGRRRFGGARAATRETMPMEAVR